MVCLRYCCNETSSTIESMQPIAILCDWSRSVAAPREVPGLQCCPNKRSSTMDDMLMPPADFETLCALGRAILDHTPIVPLLYVAAALPVPYRPSLSLPAPLAPP